MLMTYFSKARKDIQCNQKDIYLLQDGLIKMERVDQDGKWWTKGI